MSIDRGGTFTDVYGSIVRGAGLKSEEHVLKLLSEDPGSYRDAPTEGIRRILCIATGEDANPRGVSVDTAHLDEIRMGTTVATNALLERNGSGTALVVTAGLRDILRIGTQARPNIFDLSAAKPGQLYETVLEAHERVYILKEPDCTGSETKPSILQNDTERSPAFSLKVVKELDVDSLRPQLEAVRNQGISSLAVALMHSYAFAEHERQIEVLAKEIGFEHVSISSALTPMVRIVPRAFTAVVDAYLTPKIKEYIAGFRAGFKNELRSVKVLFMRSDGGLCNMDDFSGYLAILSGPAGGVVGYAKTAYPFSKLTAATENERSPKKILPKAVIGFDMGGTSTDVSRYSGKLEHVFETETAGVTIQAPQLDIATVAAGGGSRLFYRGGLFAVGPESAGAHPGPVCYRKGGHLAVTDANLVLGRVIPEDFPNIFGPEGNLPVDVDAARSAFDNLAEEINTEAEKAAHDAGAVHIPLSPEEVALGFIRVANETMCRPIRQLTEAKGHDVRDHMLSCFGGAGGQHACAIARSLGIKTVFVHKYSGILSAYGIALADVVVEKQEPLGLPFTMGCRNAESLLTKISSEAVATLKSKGFVENQIFVEEYLNLRYDGTDFAIMVDSQSARNSPIEDKHGEDHSLGAFCNAFIAMYKHEYGFSIPGREIYIDDVRVRAVCKSDIAEFSSAYESSSQSRSKASCSRRDTMLANPFKTVKCYFDQSSGYIETAVYRLRDLESARYNDVSVHGPAIVIDDDATVVVEPGCVATMSPTKDLVIHVDVNARSAERIQADTTAEKVDRVKLSIFGHRFMGIAEQMGRTLQRTSISTNIKERLDFSCALFDPTGGLVANAPHVPVHLGSLQDAVRYQIRVLGDSWKEGEVILCNHPAAGGTHLPDVTVITPVYHDGKVVFYVASRGHQADVGGIAPGSMPPFSKTLSDEGLAVQSMKIVRNGLFQQDQLQVLLTKAGGRCNSDVISDIRAQVAANNKGISLVNELIEIETLPVVHEYMHHIQLAAADAVKNMLRKISLQNNLSTVDTLSAEDYMDDGTPIRLTITIDSEAGTADFDFKGTGPSVAGNTNAPRAIAASAIIYTLRSLVGEDIPMNQGCLDPISIHLPQNSIVNPGEGCAVAGGNVLTSQRITDVVLLAFRACAASQGCMNNLTFGNSGFGYYETIAGGAGAGPGWHGTPGVHSHMTNTRITDPEILERRYPVILRRFGIREKSGGVGKWRGGDGAVREIEFTSTVTVSILSERRVYAPWGLAGGGNGACGTNLWLRADGEMVDLTGKNTVEMHAGDAVRICTPGGGGYGSQ